MIDKSSQIRATLAQTDSGCKLNISTARRDARIWLDLSSYEADYLFRGYRTLKEIKAFIENYNYDSNGYDREGYDCQGFDRDGLDRDGYDQDGLNKHNKPKPEQV